MARKSLHTAGPVYVTAKGDRFRIIWREDNRQRERTATTFADAVDICETQALRMSDGQPDHRDVTVADLVEGFVAAGTAGEFRSEWSDAQIDQMRSLLDNHLCGSEGAGLGESLCSDLTRKDATAAMAKMANAGYAAATIKHFSKANCRLVNLGVDLGVFKPERARQLKLGFKVPETVTRAEVANAATSGAQVVDVATVEQVNAFISEMRTANSVYGTLAELSATTGLRWEEAVALRIKDVDLTAGTVSVRQARKRCKGGTFIGLPKTRQSVRSIRLTESVIAQLEQLVDGHDDDDWLFTTSRGERNPITSSSSFRRSWWYPAAVRSGFGPFKWHSLRHFYATQQLKAGVPIANLSRALGHSSVRITLDIYVGTDADALETSVATWL